LFSRTFLGRSFNFEEFFFPFLRHISALMGLSVPLARFGKRLGGGR
jgi:hypothetical protein